jgi:hypothetical protein
MLIEYWSQLDYFVLDKLRSHNAATKRRTADVIMKAINDIRTKAAQVALPGNSAECLMGCFSMIEEITQHQLTSYNINLQSSPEAIYGLTIDVTHVDNINQFDHENKL